jgi:hypothetical protein
VATKHTMDTLTKDLQSFKKYVRGEFKELRPQVEEMHDFIVDYKGFERGQSNQTKPGSNAEGSININKDVFGLIIKLVLIIAAMAGIKQITS